MQIELEFKAEEFKKGMAAATEALQRIGISFRAVGKAIADAWIQCVANLYRAEVGRLPGSQRTARLRKKRRTMLHQWATKRFANGTHHHAATKQFNIRKDSMDQPKDTADAPVHAVVTVPANPPRRTRLSAMLAVSALLGMGGGYGFGGPYRDKPEPEKKPCLNCGKMKQHNNSYCSAECCRAHPQRSR